jgi:hypothetical protein
MDGVISGFTSRLPTDFELRNASRIYVTSEDEWDPSSSRFQEREQAAKDVDFLYPMYPVHRKISALAIAENPAYDFDPLHSAGDMVDRGLQERGLHCCGLAKGLLFSDVCGFCHERYQDSGDWSDTRQVAAFRKEAPKPALSPEVLGKRWGIGNEIASNTIRTTTQKGIRKVVHPVQRRLRSQPYLRHPTLRGRWYSDTVFFKDKGLGGETCAQLTTNGKGYGRFWPMKSKRLASHGLVNLIQEDGIPEKLITDNSKEQGAAAAGNTEWEKVVSRYHINRTFTQPFSWWQNRAESEVREIKRGIRKWTTQKRSPRRLWPYLGDLVTRIRSFTALGIPSLQGRTPFEHVRGYTPDISVYAQHEWYDWVWYLDEDGENHLGRWLGPAGEYGSGDCYWILPRSCQPIVRSTVWAVDAQEFGTDAMKARVDELTAIIERKIGDAAELDEELLPDISMPVDLFDADADEQPEPEEPRPDLDDYTPEAYDHYINSEIQLLVGGELRHGVVKRRVKNDDGIPIGSANENPILDTRYYEVEFPDGTVDSYSANIIAENLYAQIDDEGRMFAVLSEIVDHRKNGHAVSKENGFLPNGTGSNPSRKITTRGWELLCNWKDGSSDWVRLSDIKESHPVQVAQYAVGAKIDDEPAFAWWVPYVIRKKDRIIAKTKNRYWKRTHKYGVRLPKTVAEALQIDRDTGTDYWRKAIEKEMKNVSIAFEFNAEDLIPVGHKEIKCHMIFDVKITLVRKARFVADGHKVEEPKENTFSSVVSRDSVRLFFLLAALNNLKVLSADIQNAYLTAPIKEKYWYRTGLEFGSNQGRPAKIVRALYGLPSAGFRFRSHLASKLRERVKLILTSG